MVDNEEILIGVKGDQDIRYITNEQLYKQAIEPVKNARSFVWIGTADIKDLHVPYKGNVHSFLSVLDGLVKHCKSCKRKEYCIDPII